MGECYVSSLITKKSKVLLESRGPLRGADLRFRGPQLTARPRMGASALRGEYVYFPSEAGPRLPTPEE